MIADTLRWLNHQFKSNRAGHLNLKLARIWRSQRYSPIKKTQICGFGHEATAPSLVLVFVDCCASPVNKVFTISGLELPNEVGHHATTGCKCGGGGQNKRDPVKHDSSDAQNGNRRTRQVNCPVWALIGSVGEPPGVPTLPSRVSAAFNKDCGYKPCQPVVTV
jgi:hypothetical protein